MNYESDFTFSLSVSRKAYPTKPKNNEVGMITYTSQTMTLPELEQRVKDGYAFCYNYLPTDTGIITQKDRRIDKFDYTNVLFFDFDKMPIAMNEFIDGIKFKPSLSYTTYSNGTDGKYGYRLLYAFRIPIINETEFECAYRSIAKANDFRVMTYPDGTKYGIDYRKVNQQYYGGGEASSTYLSDIVYESTDFFTSKFKTDEENEEEDEYLYFPFKNNKKDIEKRDTSYSQMETSGITVSSTLEPSFRTDLFNLKTWDFIDKYKQDYERTYVRSLSTPLILSEDERYYSVPEDFVAVKRKWRWNNGKPSLPKWRDGEGRRRRLYLTAKIMVHNVPDIKIEQLIFNLIYERNMYYENYDKQLNVDTIVSIAFNAMNHPNLSFRTKKTPKFRVNKEYWRKLGYSPNQAKQILRKEFRDRLIANVYDFSKPVKQNLEEMKAMGIKVGKSYLYEFVKRHSDNKEKEIPFKDKKRRQGGTSYSRMEETTWVHRVLLRYQSLRKRSIATG